MIYFAFFILRVSNLEFCASCFVLRVYYINVLQLLTVLLLPNFCNLCTALFFRQMAVAPSANLLAGDIYLRDYKQSALFCACLLFVMLFRNNRTFSLEIIVLDI